MAKFWNDFKAFAFKGNIIDLAVGVMIGGAFGKITTSFVNDVVMPAISVFMGGSDLASKFVALDGNTYPTLEAAKTAGAACITYGSFIQTIIDFFIIALFVFMMVRLIAKFHKEKPAPAPEPKRLCPFCKQEVDKEATRCHHCTSEIGEAK